MTLHEFADRLDGDESEAWDVQADGARFDLEGGRVTLLGRLASPLSLYQAKSAAGAPGIDLTGTRHLEKLASAGHEESLIELSRQVGQVNEALRLRPLDGYVARVHRLPDGHEAVGGLVSREYAPVSHAALVRRLAESQDFHGATVHRSAITAERMQAFVLLDGEWEVDGQLKAATLVVNGQFGNVACQLKAMLFRLLCSNGMISVSRQIVERARHLAGLDLARMMLSVSSAGAGMVERARLGAAVSLDVRAEADRLWRHGLLTRAHHARVLERVGELGIGDSTLFGLSQAIAAAARDYAMATSIDLSELAWRVLDQGVDAVVRGRPEATDA